MSTDPTPNPIPIPATAPITINPSATSRKRTHEEISPQDESMGGALPSSRTPGISPTAIYGEGMARINPLTGTAATAETQTGTWFEDQLEMKLQPGVEETAAQLTVSDGELPKRKVQRRDSSSNADVAMAANPTESPKVTVGGPSTYRSSELGIGWTYVGVYSEFVAMARGFSRYIDNHYSLTHSELLFESKSLEAYLVSSNQGYFLFAEDLTEGRLVARTWEDTLANLQSSPVRFSWAQPLFAARTPDTGRESDNGTGSSAMAGEVGDMDMD
ncbi:hypothetical protein HO173_006640 [Letharia columbiana]|uniref:Uncharacterized protein n=1 Tax=Letharia columbiana TaxID=112416 RepID=A0A8H6L4Q7_9LECA|nr:uncharacterized protein HO173_006640 [Letharia columbiana]KAF6235443.1 hypothetical protein HO173_006640 [Letharia columbiana]